MAAYVVRALIAIVALAYGVAPVVAETGVVLDRLTLGMDRPVFVTAAPNDDSRLFIVESHTGRIKILNTANNSINATPFLDIDGIATGGEQGLLGLAFHPDYATNGKFYVNITVTGGDTEIRQYQVSANPNVASTSFTRLLTFDQPQSNHNGGWMAFNPKVTPGTPQYLHIATGDGGGGGDVDTGHTPGLGNSQDIEQNLLGKMLRIDVNSDAFPADANRNYAIPPTNPFVETAGDDEIWSYGLRNPWRNSFDRLTGDLWIADVGQGAREEVNFQPVASPGGVNYGWRVMEGTRCNSAGDPIPCNSPVLTGPIHEYNHDNVGGFSITGGYRYRGPLAELQGTYFFADYVSNRVWGFGYEGGVKSDFANWNTRIAPTAGLISGISSFGEDNAGNVYVVTLTGSIYRMSAAGEIRRNVETGANWKYLADGSNQGTAWRELTFADGAWPSGPSQLGYGETDEATKVNCGPTAPTCNAGNFITTYFRNEFQVPDLSLVLGVGVALLRDDGAAVYLNGQQIIRTSNLPAGAAFDTPANTPEISGTAETTYEIYGVEVASLRQGRNVLAAEVHQTSATSSDVSFDLRLWTILRTPTPGDTDFDGDVDRADAATLAAHYGLASGAMWINGDFNADGSVDLHDAAILQTHFGTAASASFSAAPEPATWMLTLAGFAVGWAMRRHTHVANATATTAI